MSGCPFLSAIEDKWKSDIVKFEKFLSRFNVVELCFTFSVFSKKVQIHHPIQCLFFYSWQALSLTYKEKTTRINFVNSCANHLCFCFIKCVMLNIFLTVPFHIYAPLPSAQHQETGFSFSFFLVLRKSSLMPTGLQTLWNSLGLHKMMFSKLAVLYFLPVFFYFLRCIHYHLRTRDQYLKQKGKRVSNLREF